MRKPRRNSGEPSLEETFFGTKKRKPVPHEFVLDALAPLSPWTRPMFGCLAVYAGERIVLILRDKPTYTDDNGVWLATSHEHHESLRRDFPNMRSIHLLGKKGTNWQILPIDATDFEEAALRACEFILAGDPRVGKIPGARRAVGSKAKRKSKSSTPPKPRRKLAKRHARRSAV